VARIPTAANVGQAPSPRDPGVSVPAIGQDLARGVQSVGQELSGLAERRQRVSEAVDRTLKESKARELAFQSLNDWQSSGSVAEEDSVSGFVRNIETEFKGMLDSHTGGPESRARLQAQLEGIRLDTIFKASTASTLARREILVDSVQRRQAETVGAVFQSADNLDDVLADYDKTLDDVGDALGDAVTFRLRQQGRESFVKTAMDGAIARGDLATVDSLLSDRSPYRQYISPEASTVYRAQLAKGRSSQAKQSKYEAAKRFLAENGVEVTPEIAKALVGLSSSTSDTRTPAEKTEAFLLERGIKLTPTDLRELAGLSVSKSNGDTQSKEEQAAAFLRANGVEPTPDDIRELAGLSVSKSNGDTRSKEEQVAAFLEARGVPVTPEIAKALAGITDPEGKDTRTKEEKVVDFLQGKGVVLTAADLREIAGLSDPRDPGLVAVEDGIAEYKKRFGKPPPAEWVAKLVDSAAGIPDGNGSSGPFEGTGLSNQMFNQVISGVEDYAAGNMTAQDQLTFEVSVLALATDRTNQITGETTRGSVPVQVLRALEARGKQYDPARNVILDKADTPAPAPMATPSQPPPLLRNPNLGPMNGAPPGAADATPPAAEGATLTDTQLLEKVAAYAQGASDDPSAIAQANLFARADNITGPVSQFDAAIYSTPLIGSLLTTSDTSDAQRWGTLLGRTLARARQQSPRFAVTEFEGLRKEIDLSGSVWDNPDRYRQGLITIDSFLEAIEQQGTNFVASGSAPKEEKQRIATVLDTVRFVRDGLGVKQLPHPADLNEIQALAPGTVFIYEGQHHTRSGGVAK
jgi:hypothetical protein